MIYKIKDKYFNQIINGEKSFEFRHKLPKSKNEMLIFENIDKPNDKDRFIFVKKNNWKVLGEIEKGKITFNYDFLHNLAKEYDNLFDDFVSKYTKEKTYIIYIKDISSTNNLKTFFTWNLENKYKNLLEKKVNEKIEKLGYDSKKE